MAFNRDRDLMESESESDSDTDSEGYLTIPDDQDMTDDDDNDDNNQNGNRALSDDNDVVFGGRTYSDSHPAFVFSPSEEQRSYLKSELDPMMSSVSFLAAPLGKTLDCLVASKHFVTEVIPESDDELPNNLLLEQFANAEKSKDLELMQEMMNRLRTFRVRPKSMQLQQTIDPEQISHAAISTSTITTPVSHREKRVRARQVAAPQIRAPEESEKLIKSENPEKPKNPGEKNIRLRIKDYPYVTKNQGMPVLGKPLSNPQSVIATASFFKRIFTYEDTNKILNKQEKKGLEFNRLDQNVYIGDRKVTWIVKRRPAISPRVDNSSAPVNNAPPAPQQKNKRFYSNAFRGSTSPTTFPSVEQTKKRAKIENETEKAVSNIQVRRT